MKVSIVGPTSVPEKAPVCSFSEVMCQVCGYEAPLATATMLNVPSRSIDVGATAGVTESERASAAPMAAPGRTSQVRLLARGSGRVVGATLVSSGCR